MDFTTKVEQLESDLENFLSRPELSKVKAVVDTNTKLLYQKKMLESEIENVTKTLCHKQISLLHALMATFDYAIKKAFPSISDHKVVLTPSTKDAFGDYQCNSALSLSKILKDKINKSDPRSISESIIEAVGESDLISKMEIAGPGFINIWLSKPLVLSELKKVLVYGTSVINNKKHKNIIVDMSSPNIAKEMHVGHLRSTIIGDGISNLLSFLGHKVTKMNHIGDWGTQFGMLIAHMQDKFPEYATAPPPISDLQVFYKAAKVRFDSDDEFKKRAYAAVVSLQAGAGEHTQAWKRICDISRKEFEDVYARLGIKKLIERGESFYQDRMDSTVEYLKSNSLITEEEGRQILWPPGCEIPLTIVKSDGGYTYDTSDLTAIRQRIDEEKADWIIYVVDAGQSLHFKGIFSAAEKAGFITTGLQKAEHVAFGLVLGEDRKKFKTRSGDTVRLVDLLNEGIEHAQRRLEEKGRIQELTSEEARKIKESIAYGCIKYADLSHNRTHDYVFSFDKMLDDKGNTAVYLLYSYTRIQSIARNAGFTAVEMKKMADTEDVVLDHPREWALGKAICRLPEILLRAQDELVLHGICDYLYELSCLFTDFYDACYCIQKDKATGDVQVNKSRILLCEATARTMKCCFDILGLQTIDKM